MKNDIEKFFGTVTGKPISVVILVAVGVIIGVYFSQRFTKESQYINISNKTTTASSTPSETNQLASTSGQSETVTVNGSQNVFQSKNSSALLSTNNSVKTITPPLTPTPAPVSGDFASYPTITIADYEKNPLEYYGTRIRINAVEVSNFLAQGNTGGANNYIEIFDPANSAAGVVMLQVGDTASYNQITQNLGKNDLIEFYGTGSFSAPITYVGNGSYTQQTPVIVVQRIDICSPTYRCANNSLTTIFPSYQTVTPTSTGDGLISYQAATLGMSPYITLTQYNGGSVSGTINLTTVTYTLMNDGVTVTAAKIQSAPKINSLDNTILNLFVRNMLPDQTQDARQTWLENSENNCSSVARERVYQNPPSSITDGNRVLTLTCLIDNTNSNQDLYTISVTHP